MTSYTAGRVLVDAIGMRNRNIGIDRGRNECIGRRLEARGRWQRETRGIRWWQFFWRRIKTVSARKQVSVFTGYLGRMSSFHFVDVSKKEGGKGKEERHANRRGEDGDFR
jgi:hypothetical protein